MIGIHRRDYSPSSGLQFVQDGSGGYFRVLRGISSADQGTDAPSFVICFDGDRGRGFFYSGGFFRIWQGLLTRLMMNWDGGRLHYTISSVLYSDGDWDRGLLCGWHRLGILTTPTINFYSWSGGRNFVYLGQETLA